MEGNNKEITFAEKAKKVGKKAAKITIDVAFMTFAVAAGYYFGKKAGSKAEEPETPEEPAPVEEQPVAPSQPKHFHNFNRNNNNERSY